METNINPADEILLDLRHVTKSYGSGAPALSDVSLTLPKGRIVGLLGPNGSGKTTLIKLVAGILTPTKGTILVNGEPIGEASKAAVSYLPDRMSLPASMTVRDCIGFYSDFYADFDRSRAFEMLTRLSVASDARMRTLSKGMKEKMQLVLTMSRRAKLYLLDEPIGGVDPATREYILNTIIGNYDPDSTVLISTHLISDVETVLDEFLFLKNGFVVRHENIDDVRSEQGKSVDELFREVFRC